MIIKGQNPIVHFILTQILCLNIYFLIVGLFSKYYTIVHFWYTLPILLFYMAIYYLIFWKPKMNCKTGFIVVNVLLFIVCTPIYFGVYFGLFYETLQYTLHDVKDCQVIGKQSTNVNGIDYYSILYVDFKEDDQNMLGYSCLSSQSQQPGTNNFLQPYKFLFKNDDFICSNEKNTPSYAKSRRLLEMKRQRMTASRSSRSSRSSRRRSSSSSSSASKVITCKYDFSEVKLPGWMCLPFDTSYDELLKFNKCSVHYYSPDGLETDQSKQNSIERVELKKTEQFAYISFNRLPVPLDQYMSLQVFCFCPFIMSFNYVFNKLSAFIIIQISQLKKQQKSMQRKYKIPPQQISVQETSRNDLKGSPLLQPENDQKNDKNYKGLLLNQDQIIVN